MAGAVLLVGANYHASARPAKERDSPLSRDVDRIGAFDGGCVSEGVRLSRRDWIRMELQAQPPRFSLLLCTVGRTLELERMLDSLVRQTYRSFEVVLVDQNQDQRLASIIARFREALPIVHLRSLPGLSRARNVGLRNCRGQIIGFPDDDCWYSPDLLEQVSRAFKDTGADFVTGRWQYEEGRAPMIRWPATPRRVNARHIWLRSMSFIIFVSLACALRVGSFDERLGVGAGTPWGAGEETDYLLRALRGGNIGWYEPSCLVYHPCAAGKLDDDEAYRRALSYGMGMGLVLRRQHSSLPIVLRLLVRPLGGAILAAVTLHIDRARFYLLSFKGRWTGFVSNPTQ